MRADKEKIEVVYDEYIIAYLDMLGFKNIVFSENSEVRLSNYFNKGIFLSDFISTFHSGTDGIELISDSIIAYKKTKSCSRVFA